MTLPMHRFAAGLCALVCALALPASALAAHRASTATATVAHGAASGTITAVSGTSVTIQTSGRRMGVVNALVAAANSVTKGDYPYVWGGGHAVAGVASYGIHGPGFTGHTKGLDCSGAVAAVLEGGGLWPAGASVPSDAGVIAQLRGQGLIAAGPGKAPSEVTLYDDPGVHIFMNIDGRFFGTSDGGSGNPSQRKGGAGWLDDSAWDATSRTYRRWHILPSVLHDRTTYGHSYTFAIDPTLAAFASLELGDSIHVAYSELGSGSLVAQTVTFKGQRTTTGSVQAIAPDGSTVTILTPAGATDTFAIGAGLASDLSGSLALADTVSITYTSQAGTLTARDLVITAAAPPVANPAPTGTSTTPTTTDPTSTDPTQGGNGYPTYGGPGGYGGYRSPRRRH